MLVNPSAGQPVKIHYGKNYADRMPLHRQSGEVKIVSKGRPRNHGILSKGKIYIIPCGNIISVKE